MNNLILRDVPRNTKGRDFVIGDLHGCYDLLVEKMEEVSFDEQADRIFSVGDLIDRGRESEECLNLIYEPWFYSVRGNHCEMMIDSVLHNDRGSYQCWMANGGLWALDHVRGPETWDDDFTNLVSDARSHMPLAYQIPTDNGLIGIVHAQPPCMWAEDDIKRGRFAVLWSRELWVSGVELEVRGVQHVYVGHTPVKEGPITRGNITYTDTGCSNWTGNLTMLQIN